MQTSTISYLPDVNLWVAVSQQRHAHHVAAKAWWDSNHTGKVLFCRHTQLGFMRLLCNPKVMQEDVCDGWRVWQTYDLYMTDGRVGYAEEPSGLDMALRWLTAVRPTPPNRWSDAYLAAFAQAADYVVVTFDRDFRSFPLTRVHLLG